MMAGKPKYPHLVSKIISVYHELRSGPLTAQRLGLQHTLVYRVLGANGVARRPKRATFKMTTEDLIRHMK